MALNVSGSRLKEGIHAADHGNTRLALQCFQQVSDLEMSPLGQSYFAYCLAQEDKAYTLAFETVGKALRADRNHPLIYLNLGRIYLASGNRNKAIHCFRKGLRLQRHPLLLNSMECLSSRRRPFFPFLKRTNPLNTTMGKIVATLQR